MLHSETVEGTTLELLRELQGLELLKDSRLVGGTALSLQIGHRISEDLDLFSVDIFDGDALLEILQNEFDFMPLKVFGRSLIGEIRGVKVDIIYHPFKWVKSAYEENGFNLADLADITAMKMHAIINSGKRPKDFVDLAYLSQIYSYDTMKELLLEKYPKYDPIMADRAINYFDDIEAELIPSIRMLNDRLNFEKVKRRLIDMTDNPGKVFKTNPLAVIAG